MFHGTSDHSIGVQLKKVTNSITEIVMFEFWEPEIYLMITLTDYYL
jgi:hypothetical protein